jgi:hypothetical protein
MDPQHWLHFHSNGVEKDRALMACRLETGCRRTRLQRPQQIAAPGATKHSETNENGVEHAGLTHS